jgi:DNA-directed RNA polymerase subunit alpha
MDTEFVKQRDKVVDLLAQAIEIIEQMPDFGRGKYDSKEHIMREIKMKMHSVGHTNLFLDTLTERTSNCLKRANLVSVDDICAKNSRQLLEIVNFGQKSLDELETALHNIGRQLTKKECSCGL